MEIKIRNQDGDTVDTVDLDDAVFNVPMNHSLVHQVLVGYQLNKRQGTHDTKTRAQVSGGGRKPWIQKHTGRARQGSIRAPQWRHGGVVFGPHPRSYRKGLPLRMRRLAIKCVLSDKARQDRLICLTSMDTVDGKTRSMASLLKNLNVTGSVLVVTREPETNVVRAAHNLKKIWTLPVSLLNAQELLTRDVVIITLEAVRWAEQFLAAKINRGGATDTPPELKADAVAAPPPEELEEEPAVEAGVLADEPATAVAEPVDATVPTTGEDQEPDDPAGDDPAGDAREN